MPPWNPDDPFGLKFGLQPTQPAEPGSSALVNAMMQGVQPIASTPTPEKGMVQKLQDAVTFGRKFLATNKKPTRDILIQKIRGIRFLLFSLFGKDAAIVKNLDLFLKEANTKGVSADQFAQILSDVESFSGFLSKLGTSTLSCQNSITSRVPSTINIFIIHGHDERNALSLSQLLRDQFNLKPIIILASAGMSRYLSDKFEQDAQVCSFALALFTPDDEVTNSGQTYSQARPNVFYETGWFIGRLGRPRVILLLKSGAKIHSDLEGVSRIEFANKVEEKFIDIQNELKAAKIIA
jgi:predicted nucleotide-binding protein